MLGVCYMMFQGEILGVCYLIFQGAMLSFNKLGKIVAIILKEGTVTIN